jgi:hypothetical protein
MLQLNYDGFHFLPDSKNENSVQFQYFNLKNSDGSLDNTDSDLENVNDIGPMYNVVLLRGAKDGPGVEVCDIFEAVFADPSVYAEGLISAEIYGTFVRKNKKCESFWTNYLKETLGNIEKINEELREENDDE